MGHSHHSFSGVSITPLDVVLSSIISWRVGNGQDGTTAVKTIQTIRGNREVGRVRVFGTLRCRALLELSPPVLATTGQMMQATVVNGQKRLQSRRCLINVKVREGRLREKKYSDGNSRWHLTLWLLGAQAFPAGTIVSFAPSTIQMANWQTIY